MINNIERREEWQERMTIKLREIIAVTAFGFSVTVLLWMVPQFPPWTVVLWFMATWVMIDVVEVWAGRYVRNVVTVGIVATFLVAWWVLR